MIHLNSTSLYTSQGASWALYTPSLTARRLLDEVLRDLTTTTSLHTVTELGAISMNCILAIPIVVTASSLLFSFHVGATATATAHDYPGVEMALQVTAALSVPPHRTSSIGMQTTGHLNNDDTVPFRPKVQSRRLTCYGVAGSSVYVPVYVCVTRAGSMLCMERGTLLRSS